ncbi:TPA: hypothetical protein NJ068_004796 [Vibrio parahaemolyticus]|nr:hypothetical protein [Vibrio parahaemolyticus]MCX8774013.1 hypothetical protein [Vibrio parahaemolyticus]MCX8794116.1 hypothetical protein [Vibrio parahaemolyticus]MCX8814292.1 hypothetical protein [Vibrio parahaemolyticus]MCX8855122.1 hypothetical protein [Vibrio parahaemolyticus]MCX8865371.1 hypothetical protein [Vibrio parahaemolyticus]
MRLPLLVTASLLFSHGAWADETCGDYIGSAKSGDIEKMFYSYNAGIDDIGTFDSIEYKSKFQHASTDTNDKNSKQWMMQRAYNKCLKVSPSEPLSEVIKATM